MELQKILGDRFYNDFANEVAREVVASERVGELYRYASGRVELSPKLLREKVTFRAAYVLEKIFFDYRQHFQPLTEYFVRDFCECRNSSARRHFAKIMATLLDSYAPSPPQAEQIATAAAEWITTPETKTAVRIWAMEVLIKLRGIVDWIPEILPELRESLGQNSTAAISVRLRRWKAL